MRLALLSLVLCVLAAAPARADSCCWTVIANISPPDSRHGNDSGSSGPSSWTWQYVLRADHFTIYGDMTAYAYRCTTNLGCAAAGNGTFTVARIIGCHRPVEDIEGTARNQFTARAELNDDSYAQACGSQRIKASKMTLDCHARGGVEATSSGHGSGSSGTFTLSIYPGGPNMTVHWSTGGTIEQSFQDSDGGEGGRTPETITCQTNLSLATSVGWWDDSGLAKIKNSKSQLKVWGTCDGYCGVVVPVIDASVGY